MKTSLEQTIFKNGSTTYYFSSKFFPVAVREDVFKLYSFVRVADDYVDCVPARTKDFQGLCKAWRSAHANENFDTAPSTSDSIDERVIKNMVFVTRKYGFEKEWIESFLASMQADLDRKKYKTIDDTIWYIYGSAEVIGLMMGKIMGLQEEATHAACMQGRAMQFINFLRDINEDNALGRCYFPLTDLKRFKLPDLSFETAKAHPDRFTDFMHYQLDRYDAWQSEATEGFKYIPRRLRIPLRTAVDMYNWTGQQIRQNPLIVFKRKIKPTKRQVLSRAAKLVTLPKN